MIFIDIGFRLVFGRTITNQKATLQFINRGRLSYKSRDSHKMFLVMCMNIINKEPGLQYLT